MKPSLISRETNRESRLLIAPMILRAATFAAVCSLVLLLGLVWALERDPALAEPAWGSSTDQCVLCHKGDPGAWAVAVDLYARAHDSAVGECLTCHTQEDESIHGQWGDTPEACARCHRTHSAVEDDLLTMGKDELCLFCHGKGAGLAQTNVIDGALRASGDSLRGGGFEQVAMNTSTNLANSTAIGYSTSTAEWYYAVNGAPAGNVTSRHTLGVEATIWGSWNAEGFSAVPNAGDTSTVLECVSCHDPHAYGQTYRMLTRRPSGSGVAKHPGNESDPWELRVFVTDQLAYADRNPLSDILSYTTGDYSNTEIGNKTWTGNATGWVAAKQSGTSYAAPGVIDEDSGVPLHVTNLLGVAPMYSQQISQWCASCHDRYHAEQSGHTTPGSTDSGDAIFSYRHKTGDSEPTWNEVDGQYESSSCGYGCHSNQQLNCLGCHVAHGTAAQMTPYVTAQAWPGGGGGHSDTLDDGTILGNATLQVDTRPEFTGGTDHDWEARSNLLRLDNRGVCQNPSCHPKGKESYLEPYDEVEDLCIECHRNSDAHDGIGDTDCSSCHVGGLSGGSCDACHGAPPDTGAHTSHFGGEVSLAAYGGTTNLSSAGDYNFQCGSCHPLSSESHMNDTVDVELYNAAAPEGSLKSLNPVTASYLPGGTAHADPDGIDYTLGTCSDVYCHSKTDWSTQGYASAGYPLTDPDSGYLMLDINGNLVYDPYTVTESKVYASVGWGDSSLDCNGCHRNNPRTADPWQGGNVARGVGNSHEWVGMWGYGNYHAWNMGFDPVMCRACHSDTVTEAMTWTRDGMDRTTFDDVPIANKASHANGVKDVVFDPVNPVPMRNPQDLSATTYDLETKVCSSVPCHFSQPNPEWGKPYDFYNSAECDQCHRYGGGSWPPVIGGPWPAGPGGLSMMQSPMALGAETSQAPVAHPGNPGQACGDCHDGHGGTGQ